MGVEREFQAEVEGVIDGEIVQRGMGLTQILGAWEYIDDVLLDGKAPYKLERNVIIEAEGRHFSVDFYALKDAIFQSLAVDAYNIMCEMGQMDTAQAIVDSFRKR
jgi:hypothetical protein